MFSTFSSILTALRPGDDISPGGRIIKASGGAALRLGDAVYFSATAGVVNKSVTAGDYLLFAGVVVGGNNTNNKPLEFASAPGSQIVVCSASGKTVLVVIAGIAWVYCSAAVTAPVRLGPPTTTAGEPVTYTAGQVLGIALVTTGGAGFTKIIM